MNKLEKYYLKLADGGHKFTKTERKIFQIATKIITEFNYKIANNDRRQK